MIFGNTHRFRHIAMVYWPAQTPEKQELYWAKVSEFSDDIAAEILQWRREGKTVEILKMPPLASGRDVVDGKVKAIPVDLEYTENDEVFTVTGRIDGEVVFESTWRKKTIVDPYGDEG